MLERLQGMLASPHVVQARLLVLTPTWWQMTVITYLQTESICQHMYSVRARLWYLMMLGQASGRAV